MSITPLLSSDDGAQSLTKINDNFDDLDNRVIPIGGSNTQVQFNDGGVLGGSADLVFTKATGLLKSGNVEIQKYGGGAGGFFAEGGFDIFAGDTSSITFADWDYNCKIIIDQDKINIAAQSGKRIELEQSDYEYDFIGAAANGILDFSTIASSNKTFTFPNKTGEIVLANGNQEITISELNVENNGSSGYLFADDNNTLLEIFDGGNGAELSWSAGASNSGDLKIKQASAKSYGILTMTNVTGGNKTFTFPNATGNVAVSSGTTGGSGSAGAGNQYVELNIGGTVYKLLHDGTV
jgi:hypothetical protein